jgi:hypothetical protein
MTVIKDVIDSQTLSSDSKGFTLERTYIVDGVGGSKDARLYSAITTAGVPQLNDPHPIIPDVKVTRLNATLEKGSNNIARVAVSYSVPDAEDATADAQQGTTSPGTVTLSTGVSAEQTWFDINGEFLTASFIGGVYQTAYKQADVQRPQLTVSFKRVENVLPKAAIQKYLGKVNSSAWAGFPKKTWLCTKIDASEDKEGKFNVDYGFSYNPATWRLEIILNLTPAQIEELPPNKDTGNGYARYDVYEGADFNALGLSF